MENPFKYGEPVTGESFGDREDEIQELVSDLSRGQNVIIFSPRRFGKTSLILEVLEQLKSKGFITIYVDLFRVTSKEKFITTLAEAISKSYTGKIERVVTEVRKILPRLIPKIVIKGENTPDIEFTYSRGDDERPVIDDLLEATHNMARKAKKMMSGICLHYEQNNYLKH